MKPETGNVGWLREEDAVADYVSTMSVSESILDGLSDDPSWMEIRYEDLCQDLEQPPLHRPSHWPARRTGTGRCVR